MMRLILVGSLVVLLLVILVPAAISQTPGPKVIQQDQIAYGRSMAEWTAAWWQWAFSVPASHHPLFELGECSVGQSGPVWFLGGKFCQTGQTCPSTATRSCTIPRTKAILFPLANVEDSAPEEPNWGCGNGMAPLVSGTIAEMRACIEYWTNQDGELYAFLDGAPLVTNKEKMRVRSVEYAVTMPDDNLLNAIGEGPFAGGTYSPAVDDGYYVMLSPLPAGVHTLRILSKANGQITQDIQYTLTVK